MSDTTSDSTRKADTSQDSPLRRQRLRTWQPMGAPISQNEPEAPSPFSRDTPSTFFTGSGLFDGALGGGNPSIWQRPGVVQTKLTVNEPDDQYEQEAERVADRVMRMPMPQPMIAPPASPAAASPPVANPLHTLRRRASEGNNEDERRMPPGSGPSLMRVPTYRSMDISSITHISPIQALLIAEAQAKQAKAVESRPSVSLAIESRIKGMNGGGSPLPDSERNFFEERMGADFSGVRIHTDHNAVQASRGIKARAFTTHHNIAFNLGEYQPGTTAGRHLLAHELTHTIQQGGAGELKRKVDEGKTEKRAPVAPPGAKTAAQVGGAENDPDFMAVTQEVEQVAQEQKEHEPASAKADEAAAAAEMPKEEKEGLAENEQTKELQSAATAAQAKSGRAGFDKSAFKAAIKAKIEELTPTTPEELENIESGGLMGRVKEALTGQISEGKDKAQGQVDDKIEEEPDASSVAEKKVTPLSPNDPGAAPSSVDGTKAAPKAKEESEVEKPLAENLTSLEEQMSEAELTDKQLLSANEPAFVAAAESKKAYQTHAKKAPVAYRAAEVGTLSTSQSQAGELTQSGTLTMFEERGEIFGDLDGLQTDSKTSDEAKRQEIGQAINEIYQATKKDVQTILEGLESDVDNAFNQGAQDAQEAATKYIKTETQSYKDARYNADETIDTSGSASETFFNGLSWVGSQAAGLGKKALDTVVGMPAQYQQIYEAGRDKYIAQMDKVLDAVATLVGQELGKAKTRIKKGRKEISDYVAKQPDELKQVALDAAENIQGQFDELETDVDSKADSLVNSLAEAYNQNLADLDSQLDALKEADKGLLQKATDNLSGVIATINSLREMLMGVLNSAKAVVTTIIADPIGFLSNLIGGVKQGVQNFLNNIGTHLQKGLATWLFGEVAKAGIEMPQTLDMKGMLQLGMQVLGLTWDFIRARAAKLLGEEVVSKLEESFELFIIIKEQGLGGLWEHIQSQLGDLKATIIGGIKEMVASEVIEAGIQWLIGILGGPAGAFIKAAKAIYDLVMWFVDNGSQMLELVQAVINSVTAIANGAVAQAAQYVEQSLAKAIPVTIGFLASLLGLGDLSGKIKGIIERAQEPIGRAVDWVIGKAQDFAKTLLKNKNKDGKGPDLAQNKDGKEPDLAQNKEELGQDLAKNKEGLSQDLAKNAKFSDKERQAGLAAIDKEEEKYLEEGEISQKEAQQVAVNVLGTHPVFKSISVVDGGETWDYEYVQRRQRKKGSRKEEALREIKKRIFKMPVSMQPSALFFVENNSDKNSKLKWKYFKKHFFKEPDIAKVYKEPLDISTGHAFSQEINELAFKALKDAAAQSNTQADESSFEEYKNAIRDKPSYDSALSAVRAYMLDAQHKSNVNNSLIEAFKQYTQGKQEIDTKIAVMPLSIQKIAVTFLSKSPFSFYSWSDFKKSFLEYPQIKEIYEKPLNKTHDFGKNTHPLALTVLQEVDANSTGDNLSRRKAAIHDGKDVNGDALKAVRAYMLGEIQWKTVVTPLKAAFKNTKKSNSVDNVFTDETVRKLVIAAVNLDGDKGNRSSPHRDDWAVVFPAKGRKFFAETNPGKFKEIKMGQIFSQKNVTQKMISDRIEIGINKTIQRDNKYTGKKRTKTKINTVSKSIAGHMYNKSRAVLVTPTDIPRYLTGAEASDLIRTNNKPNISELLYKKVATLSKRLDFNYEGEIHHVVPLYLGGSHHLNNLLNAQGKARHDAAISVHREMHDLIDTQEDLEVYIRSKIEGEYVKVNLESLTYSDIKNSIKNSGNDLKLLIGTLFADSSIEYKETNISV